MFKKSPRQPEDPLNSGPHSEQFLDAQNQRLINRSDIHGNPLSPQLPELVLVPSPNRYMQSIQKKFADGENAVRDLMDKVYCDYMKAYRADEHYDPFDDETFISQPDFSQMSPAYLDLLSNYFTYLENELRGKHAKIHPTGRHAVRLVFSGGRRGPQATDGDTSVDA